MKQALIITVLGFVLFVSTARIKAQAQEFRPSQIYVPTANPRELYIKQLEKTIRQQRIIIHELNRENKRLVRACKRAGLNIDSQQRTRQIIPELDEHGQPLGFTTMNVGEISWGHRVRITQIVDDANAIISLTLHRRKENEWWPTTKKTAWLTGVSMIDHTDDSIIHLNYPCIISGTKSYTAAMGGKRTLPLIRPFNEDELSEIETTKKPVRRRRRR